MTRRTVGLLPVLAAAAMLAVPAGARAQASQLDVAEAQAFLGSWTLAFQSEMGPFEMGLNIRDVQGKVAAQVTSELGNLDITTISRAEDSLVLSYTMEAQGQSFPVSMTLKPNGEQLQASMDFAGGTFMVSGTGTKSPS
jgi:hypothetical protein